MAMKGDYIVVTKSGLAVRSMTGWANFHVTHDPDRPYHVEWSQTVGDFSAKIIDAYYLDEREK